LKIAENQPVVFDLTDDSCSFNRGKYSQPVQFGDVTQFQLQLLNCDDEDNVISQGNFCSLTGIWSTFGRGIIKGDCQISHTAGSAGWISQTSLAVGKYYRTEISVLSQSAGVVEVYNGYNKVGTIEAAGDYIFYGFCDENPSLMIKMSAACDAVITGVSAFHIDLNHKILINDSTGTTLSTLNLSDYITSVNVTGTWVAWSSTTVIYYDEYVVYGDIFTLADNYLTVKIDWNDLSLDAGCYYIGIAKACENTNSQLGIYNGDFTLFDPDFTELKTDWNPLGWTIDESTVTPLDGKGEFYYDYVTGKCTFTGFAGAQLNGTNQYLSTTAAAFDKTNSDFAFSVVFRLSGWSIGDNVSPMAKWYGLTGDQSYRIFTNPITNKIAFAINDGTSSTTVDSTVDAANDVNYYAMWVYDSVANLLKGSVNGETFITVAQSTGAQNVSPTPLTFGYIYAGLDWYLDGYIANATFWDYAPSQADLTTMWNGGYPLDVDDIDTGSDLWTNMVSYWKFGSDSLTNDSRGANDLTNNNTATHYSEYVTMTSKDQSAAISYDTTMVIDSETGSKLRLQMGSTNGTYRTEEGTYNETIVGTSGDIVIRYLADHGITKLVLDSVSSVLTNTSDYISNSQSQLHNVQDSFTCSLLIHMVNNHNAFDFEFEESTFVPTIRLFGRIRRAQYGGERETTMDGLGTEKVTYAQRRKRQTLMIESVPEFVHDFLMNGAYLDFFYVNGNQYIWSDDEPPSIDWNQFNMAGAVEIDIEKVTQNTFNINIGTRMSGGAQPPSTTQLLSGASETTGDNINFADQSTHTINPGG